MEFDVTIIGTGFGAFVAVTKLLEKKANATILLLELGLWCFTTSPLPDFIKNHPNPKKQPVQDRHRPKHAKGIVDLLSIVRTNSELMLSMRQEEFMLATRP